MCELTQPLASEGSVNAEFEPIAERPEQPHPDGLQFVCQLC
jgi:hypothetical protein